MNSFPDHIQWILNKHRDALQFKAKSDGFEIEPHEIMQTLMAADPSQKKGAVDWLVRTWIGDGFLWEDIAAGENSRVAETLVWFGTYRKQLDGNKRNLNEYTSVGEVYNVIRNFIPLALVEDSQSAKKIKRKERDIVMQQTKIICKTPELIIAVPLTQKASEWWGRGTRWCTSAQTNNYFNSYNARAPLVISIFPKGIADEKDRTGVRKFQFQSGSSLSFMDEADSAVPEDYVWSNWPSFKPLIVSLKEIYPETVRFVPPSERTVDDYLDWIKTDKCPSLKEIPLKLRTKELCDLYLEQGGAIHADTLRAFPREFLTREILLKIVRANIRNAFSFIKQSKSLKPIVEDIKLRFALKSISKELYDEPVYMAGAGIRTLIHYLPKFLIEKKLFLNVVKFENLDIQDDLLKKYSRYMDQELWTHIINHSPYNIKNIPLKYLTADLMMMAIRINPYILRVAPLHHIKLSKDFYMEIFEKHGNALQALPCHLRTAELCRKAVSNFGASLNFVPAHLITSDLCKLAVQSDSRAIAYVPSNMITGDLYTLAIEKNGKALEWVTEHLRTPELCKLAVQQDGRALEYCPTSVINRELVRLAVEQNLYAGRTLDEHQLTAEICLSIVEKDPEFVREFLPHCLTENKEFVEQLLVVNPLCSLYIDPDITKHPQEIKLLQEQSRDRAVADISQHRVAWDYSILDTLAESIQEISSDNPVTETNDYCLR